MDTTSATSDARRHVLIVDDDRSVANLITAILDAAGYLTTTVSSCAEALAVASRQTIDLVISDLVLGGDGDGSDVIEGVHALQPNAQTLLISGYERSNDSLADEGVLAKPFDVAVLLRRVERCLPEDGLLSLS